MTFLLKFRYVKSSFKIGTHSASLCSVFPSPGTKQSATSRMYSQSNLLLFSGSRVPQARCSSKSHQPAAYGKEDKRGRKAQEQRSTCSKTNSPATGLPLTRSLVVWSRASRREQAMCPNSGRKKWMMKMSRGLKMSKSKYGFHVVQENTKKKSGKQLFMFFGSWN